MRGMEAPPTPRITCRDRLKAGRPVLHYPLEAFAWAHILAIQWLPWLAPYAMQETYFLRGLALGVAVEGGNIVISFALYRLGYILTFPKMLDLCLLSALVPLLIATYVGNDDVQFGCWAYMQLAINCAAAGTITPAVPLPPQLSVCLPHKRAFSVAEQYMRDVEGGDHRMWDRPAWIKHNWWINLLWAVTMTLMAAATAVSGATAHPDRTWVRFWAPGRLGCCVPWGGRPLTVKGELGLRQVPTLISPPGVVTAARHRHWVAGCAETQQQQTHPCLRLTRGAPDPDPTVTTRTFPPDTVNFPTPPPLRLPTPPPDGTNTLLALQSTAGTIANYDVQLGIFGAAVLINLVYTLCLRRYYKPSKGGDSPPSLDSAPMAPDVGPGLGRDLELAQHATQDGHKAQQVSRKEGREPAPPQPDSRGKVSPPQSESPHHPGRDADSPPMSVESYGPTAS
ncbi:MAG: hypothetical protein WDW36_001011 [Sanguina aurantia]